MDFSSSNLRRRLNADLGDSVSVSLRGPGRLLQVDLPTFLADGDAVAVFVEPSLSGDAYVVSDLAQTIMRLSHTRSDVAKMLEQLEELAQRHGFAVQDGAIRREATDSELTGTIIELAKVEICVESAFR